MPTNARLFLWFRLLFNCRLYYPVFTVLFLDLGLSLAEFAALNVLWAATIVCLEIPSGALADQFGRRPLVIAAGGLMVAEMLLLCLMPVGHHDAVLWLFVINRLLSGMAEACASGADEALAYDSLPDTERAHLWPRLMAQLSRMTAAGFILTSVTGAFLYDHERVQWLLESVGLPVPERAWTMKIPLLLNLGMSLACLMVALRLREDPPTVRHPFVVGMRSAWRSILDVGRWFWLTPAALTILVLGVVFDSIIRLFLTVSSNFYRLVGVTEAWYGVIGTTAALLGLATAGLMERMTRRHSMTTNFAWLAVMTMTGLFFAAYPQSGWLGVALILPLMLSMRFLQFFLSHYLNAVADSSRRATALSFRGLTQNLAYGIMTLLFGWHSHWLEQRLVLPAEDPRVFAASLAWWPWWFAGSLALALLWLRIRSRRG